MPSYLQGPAQAGAAKNTTTAINKSIWLFLIMAASLRAV
jgi:hypothetical protein